MRVNLGCGQAYLEGWVNVDASPNVRADVRMDAIEFVRQHGADIEEVFMGHVLEHLLPTDALSLLILINERTRPGCLVSAVTPDMAAIFSSYLSGEMSNMELNEEFVYSYVQPSHHVWCHDASSLTDLFRQAGLDEIETIDPSTWPPVFHKTGRESRFQCGVKGRSTGEALREALGRAPYISVSETPSSEPSVDGNDLPPSQQLMDQVRLLREEAIRQASMRMELERELRSLRHVDRDVVEVPEVDAAPLAGADRRGRDSFTKPAPVSAPGLRDGGRLRDVVAPEGSARRAHIRAARILAHHVRTIVKDGLQDAEVAVREYHHAAGHDTSGSVTYRQWCIDHDPTKEELRAQSRVSSVATHPTRFLVLIEDSDRDLPATVRSLTSQSWSHWEAVVLGTSGVSGFDDPRVTYHRCTVESMHGAMNGVAERTDSDFVLFLRAGDLLAPNCLFALHTAAWSDPLVDLVTFDDDVLGANRKRTEPRFRPDWSPEMLLGFDYIDGAFAMRRARFLVSGGLRHDRSEGGCWDLLLRSGLDATRVTTARHVLLHRGQPRQGLPAEVAKGILAEHVRDLGLPARVESQGGCNRLVWELPEWPTVSVVIPTRHNRRMLERLLPSLRGTDYPGHMDVTIVDNGEHTADNSRWYEQFSADLKLEVQWWDEPFNYSKVNNRAARSTDGQVLVFLNDDMEVLDPGWLAELVGWATQPEIGLAGMTLLDADGKVQHAGAILGLGGFADHVFQGMDPHATTIFGPVHSYRNVLAVTGACTAVLRERFEAFGGFDENFELCGSDVALGLSAAIDGYRTVCTPFTPLRHFESVTRGTEVPLGDFYASYWRYNPWLFGGDPYFSPCLSLGRRVPALRGRNEPTPGERIAGPLGRSFTVFRQRGSEEEAVGLADLCRTRPADAVVKLHAELSGASQVKTVNWFIPDIDSPFYGGINTAFRIAAHLAEHHGVENRFVVWGGGPAPFVESAVAAAFPSLRGTPTTFIRDFSQLEMSRIPEADAGIATLWVTAYALALSEKVRRKFYLIQDFEPMFYPAGTQYALAEETYRLGLYGLCNTENLAQIYRSDYGGRAASFTPAIDPTVFHADGRPYRSPRDPVTVFVYARPGHWRNCWEMASLALEQLKERLGDRVRILTAGSWAVPDRGFGGMRHLGLLDYRATGALYRQCDVGLALTVSKHPSYLPLELMACGVPVVAFDNPWGHWILRDGENCLLADRTVDGLADRLERLCVDAGLRERLQHQGLRDIASSHGSWASALSGIYSVLCDPEGSTTGQDQGASVRAFSPQGGSSGGSR